LKARTYVASVLLSIVLVAVAAGAAYYFGIQKGRWQERLGDYEQVIEMYEAERDSIMEAYESREDTLRALISAVIVADNQIGNLSEYIQDIADEPHFVPFDGTDVALADSINAVFARRFSPN
jgi:hypothetical protein